MCSYQTSAPPFLRDLLRKILLLGAHFMTIRHKIYLSMYPARSDPPSAAPFCVYLDNYSLCPQHSFHYRTRFGQSSFFVYFCEFTSDWFLKFNVGFYALATPCSLCPVSNNYNFYINHWYLLFTGELALSSWAFLAGYGLPSGARGNNLRQRRLGDEAMHFLTYRTTDLIVAYLFIL